MSRRMSNASSSSGFTPSTTSSDDLADAFAGLHLDASTPNLNKYKLRCVALGCAVGATIKQCKRNIAAIRAAPASKLQKHQLRCLAAGCAVGTTIEECKINLAAAQAAQRRRSRHQNAHRNTPPNAHQDEQQNAHQNAQDNSTAGNKEAEREREQQAVRDFFTERYGANNARLESWQQLCRDLHQVEGNSITQCKKVVRSVFVYIHHYVKAIKEGKPVVLFPSLDALRAKIKKKPFPLEAAKQSEYLKAMLVFTYGNKAH